MSKLTDHCYERAIREAGPPPAPTPSLNDHGIGVSTGGRPASPAEIDAIVQEGWRRLRAGIPSDPSDAPPLTAEERAEAARAEKARKRREKTRAYFAARRTHAADVKPLRAGNGNGGPRTPDPKGGS